MAKKKAADKAKQVPFEEAIQSLEAIVRRLEDGGSSLDESLDDYSKAIGLLKSCHTRLDEAQRRVELLTGVDSEGNPVTEPFEASSDDLVAKKSQRAARRTGTTARSKPASDDAADETELF